jgi:hypothetical protein
LRIGKAQRAAEWNFHFLNSFGFLIIKNQRKEMFFDFSTLKVVFFYAKTIWWGISSCFKALTFSFYINKWFLFECLLCNGLFQIKHKKSLIVWIQWDFWRHNIIIFLFNQTSIFFSNKTNGIYTRLILSLRFFWYQISLPFCLCAFTQFHVF